MDIYKNIEYQNYYYNSLILLKENKLIEYQKEKEGYEKVLLPDSSNYIVIVKPIIMHYNIYELSHLNGWDGNKLYTDADKDQYMFMPQMGADTKENAAFTGVFMGLRNLILIIIN